MALFRLFGNLERLVDEHQPLDIPAPTLRVALADLTKQCPRLVGELVQANGEFNRSYSVLVNGEMIEFLDDLDTALLSTDEVSIFPPAPA